MVNSVTKRWTIGLIEYMIIFPIILFIGIYFSTQPLLWAGSLPVLAFLGLLLRTILKSQKRWVYVVITTVIAVSFTFFFNQGWVSYLLLFLVSWVSIYRGVGYGERDLEDLNPYPLLWKTGFPIYIIGYFFYRLLETLNEYLSIISWLGVLMVIISLFISNSLSLRDSTLSKNRKPFVASSIKGKNRFYIFVMVASIALITNFKIVQTFVQQLFILLGNGLLWLTTFFGSDDEGEMSIPPGGMGPLSSFEASEPARFWVLLEKVVFVVMAVGAVIVGIVLLYYAAKNIVSWLKKSFRWLQQFLTNVFHLRPREDDGDYQYIDEKESLVDFTTWGNKKTTQARERFRKLLQSKPNWEELSSAEKVRYVFREFVAEQQKRGYQFKQSETPNEIVQIVSRKEDIDYSPIADLYGKMKYGEQEITEEEAGKVSVLLDRVEKKR
ncbi:DUF4129 domain-containing protein [Anaerobacillus alkaliphilus]|uniref:DUF4129 domain-containing protein n=1 Tax=Anaerobacillus alkaliphilus TaxID=1548597 RepID=A0A4Q0VVX9_9BACI|nr:DUF4129 domain-containing protein [Anaerobacillus alkaliphilus]RXJ02792.1 DUF4129 domain-containing protein [Anaerobacillus alkaliphilus]